jgi:hypothetical protein
VPTTSATLNSNRPIRSTQATQRHNLCNYSAIYPISKSDKIVNGAIVDHTHITLNLKNRNPFCNTLDTENLHSFCNKAVPRLQLTEQQENNFSAQFAQDKSAGECANR